MPEELAEDDLPPTDRIADQQQHRTTFYFADNRIMRQQQCNQRHQQYGKARQADDDDIELVDADIAGRRAAEEGQSERKRCQQQRRGQHPAVPQAFLDLLARHDQYIVHRIIPRPPRKWA
ncbi:hypothetical protein D3C80_1433350 [compost metagenome]